MARKHNVVCDNDGLSSIEKQLVRSVVAIDAMVLLLLLCLKFSTALSVDYTKTITFEKPVSLFFPRQYLSHRPRGQRAYRKSIYTYKY